MFCVIDKEGLQMKKTIKILEKGRVKEKEITYIPVRFIIAILLILQILDCVHILLHMFQEPCQLEVRQNSRLGI